MDPVQPKPGVFSIGICMAGAVSAGAYTAGVMDYLLESLAEWEKRRGQPGVPSHRVEIPVIGGASAGGMTGIITASALNSPVKPLDRPGDDLLAEHPENKFYHAWVDLTGTDMFSKMLDTGDIQPGLIPSGLNSNFIDEVAAKMIVTAPGYQPLPPYIAPGLKVFTTLSNLGGFPYSADFYAASAGNRKYHMQLHNDYACFQLTEMTDTAAPNAGWVPLNFKTGINLSIARNAAMATGAFPVGLKSRLLERDAAYVNANPFLQDIFGNTPVGPGAYTTLNVDGGMINNEPFEKVREELLRSTGQPKNTVDDPNHFNSTILMIEPFPTTPPVPISMDQGLLHVIGLTLSTMISQMRSKPLNIANALNENCAGQYLIAPSRLITGPDGTLQEVAGERAIACGALNGFSGFINKEFRVHDYYLGRYNCKIFLRDYFTVSKEAVDANAIFANGYAGLANKDDFKSTRDYSYQIIPQFKDYTDYTFPDFKFSSGANWPAVREADIDQYQPAVKKRMQALIKNAVKLNWWQSILLGIGSAVLLSGSATKAAMDKIKADLRLWQLLP
ncbi:hypothetical protein BEL04_08255 [Mucilaginibacter sp. PPCGB 2223]|nr:hypothetical protein BEL04_08255 [Mucilaginibacter sp. PPCGB 2223]